MHVHEPGKQPVGEVPDDNVNQEGDDRAEQAEMDVYDNIIDYGEVDGTFQGNDDPADTQALTHRPTKKPTAPMKSTLAAWFKLNEDCNNARQYTYTEIPENFRYIKKTGEWVPRKRARKIVGRMYHVSPRDVELYHLRVLLLYVKGATSFEDLKRYEGTEYRTFAEACVARGLAFDDQEHHKAMEEAANWVVPRRLRMFFAMILAHCEPKEPLKLWTTFKVSQKLTVRAFSMEATIHRNCIVLATEPSLPLS